MTIMFCLLSGLVSLVRRALVSKLRGPGFKSWSCIVSGLVTIIMPVRATTSFEINPVTESKQGTFPFSSGLTYEIYCEDGSSA